MPPAMPLSCHVPGMPRRGRLDEARHGRVPDSVTGGGKSRSSLADKYSLGSTQAGASSVFEGQEIPELFASPRFLPV